MNSKKARLYLILIVSCLLKSVNKRFVSFVYEVLHTFIITSLSFVVRFQNVHLMISLQNYYFDKIQLPCNKYFNTVIVDVLKFQSDDICLLNFSNMLTQLGYYHIRHSKTLDSASQRQSFQICFEFHGLFSIIQSKTIATESWNIYRPYTVGKSSQIHRVKYSIWYY